MKKRVMFKKVFLFNIFILMLFISASTTVGATTTGTSMYYGVDYSGQGTRIDYNLREQAATESSSGNYLYVPVYKGKYENQQVLVNDWMFHSWSSWSTSNNKTNDYNNYRGESITEYDVQSKVQYKYRRWDDEKTPLYTTYYVTKYKGSHWYDSFLTKTVRSTYRYPGALSGWTITDRYTEREITDYKGGYDYYSGWRDSAPFSPLDPWSSYTSRTVYRYRARTIEWNENANPGIESTPMKYSFNDRTGNPIDYGIKIVSNATISPNASTGLFNPAPDDWNYDVTTYYLNTDVLEQELHHAIMTVQTEDSIILAIRASIQAGASTVTAVLGVIGLFSESAVIASLGAVAAYAGAIILPIALANIYLQYEAAITYSDLVKTLGDWSEHNYIGISFVSYNDLDSDTFMLPDHDMEVKMLDKKSTSSDDIDFLSMNLTNNDFTGIDGSLANVYYDDFNLDYYGTVSYVDDIDEVKDDIQDYFDSFNVFDIMSWFGL